MADTLVERVTGQAAAGDVPVELTVLMPVEALVDPQSNRTAELAGAGPLPAGLAREIIAGSAGRRWWGRLFTSATGQVVGGDPARRRFDGWLAKLIELRDQSCRDPYCDAPIRHHDHIRRWADGGPTMIDNGRGVCERGNHVREMPGWRVSVIHTGFDGQPHTTLTSTPTGHTYLSAAPQPP